MLQTKAVNSYCISLEALGRANRTIEANKERLEGLQKFLIKRGVVEIENIDPELLDAYISSSYRKGLSLFTVAGRVQVIKTFFKWSVERKYLKTSPASHLKKPLLNYSAKNKAMHQDDLEAMILFSRRSKNLMVEVMLMLFADTGCRSGELCGMDIEDIDFAKKEVWVNGKTGERLLDFTFTTAIKLGVYADERRKMNLSTQSLFINSDGERIKPQQVYGRFRLIAKELNIKRFNPQSIRHRVGQGWLDQGANLETVRQKLGHKDIQTTALFYSHQDRERLKKASQKFCLVKNL